MSSPRDSQNASLCVLVSLTVLGGVLRSIGLNQQLWYDEIITVTNTIRIPLTTLLTSYSWDNQHTFYSVLASLSAIAFGEHPWSIRLPAMVAGTMSIPAIYLLGRTILSSRESLCAAAVLTVSYHHIWFSQNARGYTILMLGTLIATWAFVEGQKRQSLWLWTVYAVVVALGAYTHLTMVFVAVSHMLIVIAQWVWASWRGEPRRRFWQPTLAIVASGILTILIYAPMMDDLLSFYTTERPASPAVEWTKISWAIGEALRGLQIGYGAIVLVGLGVIGLAGSWRMLRSSPLMLATAVLPGLMGLAVMVAAGRNIWPRFFLFVFGNVLLIVIDGIWAVAEFLTGWIKHPQRRQKAIAGLGFGLCGVAVLQSCRMLPPLYTLPKQDLLAAIALIDAERNETDEVVTVGVAWHVFQQFYQQDWQQIEQASTLDELLRNGKRVWTVSIFPIQIQAASPEIAERLETDFELVESYPGTVGGGEVRVHVHPPL